jgi:hypothetical protein
MFSACYTGKISRFARNDNLLRLYTSFSYIGNCRNCLSSRSNIAKKHRGVKVERKSVLDVGQNMYRGADSLGKKDIRGFGWTDTVLLNTIRELEDFSARQLTLRRCIFFQN